MESKLNEKFEISGYSPDFNSGLLKVMATDLSIDNAPELEHVIPFSEIAKAYYPDGEGEFINVVMYYNGFDKDSGPYT